MTDPSAIQAASELVSSLSELGSALVTFIGVAGTLLTAITHAVALIPKDKFGFAYGIFRYLAGNYGHAANAPKDGE
ncbi:MAG: hypothetical protein ACXV8O_01465 [Methylobacter sp.]